MIQKTIIYRERNYTITNCGKLIGVNGQPRKLQKNSSGYPCVTDENKMILIHRLVAFEFVENPDNKILVNHKDGDKQNNHYSNLEWCTHSENNLHAVRVLGCKKNLSGLEKTWVDSPNKRAVYVYDKHNNLIDIFESGKACAKAYGILPTRVSNIIAYGKVSRIGKDKFIKITKQLIENIINAS